MRVYFGFELTERSAAISTAISKAPGDDHIGQTCSATAM
jgi:hypothetical protein